MPYRLLAASLFLLLIAVSYAQEQNFVIKPSDTNVRLGETATLRCSVTPRHGDVQWIHEGTALGYDRKIRGKPRYSLIGDNEDTEYHLRIENVTLDDEGVFACQAAPIGDWDTKLESKAKLTVLIPPRSRPEIYFIDESKNANDLVHIRHTAFKTSKFMCRVRKSKPASAMKWFLNDALLTMSNAVIVDSVQKDGLYEDLTSTLEFKPTINFNNSVLRCQAFHLSYGITTELANMSSSLRVVVVYPPSVPIITGYDAVNGIVAGNYLGLTCMSSHTFPPAKLTWFKDKLILTTNYETTEVKSESKYLIKVEPSDNQAQFRCEAINQALDAPLTSDVKINVHFGPSKVDLSGVFEVKVGEEVKATCICDSSNPFARIRFTFDGLNYEPLTQLNTPAQYSGLNSTATFSKVVGREHNGKELKCMVENSMSKIQREAVKFVKVLYPPESIDMVYAPGNNSVSEGTMVKFICVAKGGNPAATIEWKIGTMSYTNVAKSQTLVFTTESTLEIELKRDMHDKTVECLASNKVASLTKYQKLNVSYLPLQVKIVAIEPPKSDAVIKAGSRVVLACLSTNSNPESQITWFKDSYAVAAADTRVNISAKANVASSDFDTTSYVDFIASSSDHNKEIRCDVKIRGIQRTMHASLVLNVAFAPEMLKPPSSVIDINENANFSLNLTARANPVAKYACTANNGKTYKIENTMLFFNASRSDNAIFKCQLSNTENTTEIQFRLNVKYGTSTRANSSVYIANKGSKVQMQCHVSGNPLEPNHISWRLNNKPMIASTRILPHYDATSGIASLTVVNVEESDDGNYSCNANNMIGTSAASVAFMQLNVKRAPVILDDSVLKAAEDSNQGLSARLICKVRAYPDASFKWRLPTNAEITNSAKYSIVNTKLDSPQLYQSVLTINSVVSSDYGGYICEAKNDMGAPVIAKASLGGKHQPEKPSDFKVVNLTRNSITLAWKKNFDGGDLQRFRIRYRKDTIDPTYKYVETMGDEGSIVLDNLEMATRYIINIQSLNKYGTEGFLKEPLVVQTDFGFNDVNQMPIYNGNDLPLTIILIVCGVGTLLLLFNVALIVYFIRKRKRKGETDSTTDTNETDANTVEMFSPPPPYPDELNYQLDAPHLYDDENKPFVPPSSTKYLQQRNQGNRDCTDYSVEYATPLQTWADPNELLSEDTYSRAAKDYNSKVAMYGDMFVQAHAFPIESSNENNNQSNSNSNNGNNNNSSNGFKIYQDLDEYKGHLV